jgi:23S rRNA (cytosine1962-C5)-methyltransferase
MTEPTPDGPPTILPAARLLVREERRLVRGHCWAYRNEFAELPALKDGDLVRLVSHSREHVGVGFYQEQGGIAVRLLAHGRERFDEDLLSRRIEKAAAFRRRLFPQERAWRWIHGESDGLPGLIADRYDRLVVVQADSPFYRSRAEALAAAFLAEDGVTGVLFRGEGAPRFGTVETPVVCSIHGLAFSVDPLAGQKTGLFLDQRVNWTLLAAHAPGARVLDGHCYVGAWSLHAAQYGAREVVGVDTSRPAIELARANAERNGLADRCSFLGADVQEVLARGETYDVIVIDPPALAKGRAPLVKALGLYQAINRDAIKALNPGGVLITSSCSQPVDDATFLDMLKRAAIAAERRVQLLDLRGAAPDHPALLTMPETRYLKCAVLRLL